MVTRLTKNERGIALLVTLLAVALMTLLVADFTTSAALGYRSAADQANELRAAYLARSGVSVGLSLLAADTLKDSFAKAPYDGLDETWALPYPPVPLGGGVASVSVVDEARKIDINAIINPQTGQPNPDVVGIIERLFALIGVSPQLVPAIIDWVDPDSVESPGGAEADYYLQLRPPYQPRNGPMPTIGDLRMIKGVDQITFRLLTNYLTASPEPMVNINTAPPEIIASLVPGLDSNVSLVKAILAARSEAPFTATTDVGNLPGMGNFATPLMQHITIRSSYFSITGNGTYAGARRTVTGVFRRNADGSAMLANWHED